MKLLKWSSLLSLVVAGASFAPLGACEPDWLSVVGLYPQPATVAAQSEVAILLWLQDVRTAQDVARVREETTPSFGCFASAIHAGVTANAAGAPQPIEIGDFPKTAAILEQAREDVTPLLEALTNSFLRPWPYTAYPAVVPALPEPSSFSYPSPHATWWIDQPGHLALFQAACGEWHH